MNKIYCKNKDAVKLAHKFKCSACSVSRALAYSSYSYKAKQIRSYAVNFLNFCIMFNSKFYSVK